MIRSTLRTLSRAALLAGVPFLTVQLQAQALDAASERAPRVFDVIGLRFAIGPR